MVTRRFPALIAVPLVLILATSCSRATPSAATVEASPSDVQFATSAALLEHFNRLSLTSPVVDLAPILELVYPETELHTRLVRILHGMLLLTTYRQALWDHFDEVRQRKNVAPLAPAAEPARITEHSGQRAIATQLDNDGTTITLHLVQIGDRWWVSAYTYEYDPALADIIAKLDTPDSAEPFYNAAIIAVPPIIAQVKRSAFQSSQEADQALRRAIAEHGG